MADELQSSVNALNNELEKLKDVDPHALYKGALLIWAKAVPLAPIKTGALRGSGFANETEEGAEVGFGVEYAYIQELKKGYLRRAIDENEDEIVQVVADEIAKNLGDKL